MLLLRHSLLKVLNSPTVVCCLLLLLLLYCCRPRLPSLLLLLHPRDQAVAPSPCALLLHALLLQCVLLYLLLAGTSALLHWPCRTKNPPQYKACI
jgi:hypothetical protein